MYCPPVGLYGRYVLPRLVHLTCGLRPVMRQRQKVVPRVAGRVLEVGFGSGLNLPFYDGARVERLWALEPSDAMWELARDEVARAPFPIERLTAEAEGIPLADGTADQVLVTYALCTVPDAGAALAEIRRVLVSGGRLVFCEHGAAPETHVRRWQDRLDPLWTRLAGGCHLNRPIPELLERAGFRIQELSTMYLPGWKPATYNLWGTAV